MENLFKARISRFLKNKFLLLPIVFCWFLFGCASSDVSRHVAGNVDQGFQNANNLAQGTADSSITDSYQNTSQTTKGALIGGATGAVTGALTSGIGVLPAAAVGTIIGGSYGSYIDANTTLQDRLENRDVNVIVLGDQILIVLPSSTVFQAMTATIKSQAYSTLNLVAQYINQYTTMSVKVAAYTNAMGPSRVNLALSQQQAESVAKYLWAAGLNTRLLSAKGYGGRHLVERNSLDWEGSDNYRIEILFEKFPV